MALMMITLGQIAEWVTGELAGDPDCTITGAGPLDSAEEGQISFAEKGLELKRITATKAAAVIVPRDFTRPDMNLIQVDNPRLAFTTVLDRLYPQTRPDAGVHPSAVIGKRCTIGKDAAIAAHVVLGDDVTVGDRAILDSNVVIGDQVSIGEDTRIYPNVFVGERCCIGRRVIIHAGTVIGSDGFGFVFDQGRYHKMPQVGIVQIDDDVEIGANNTIDRATMGKTWLKSGIKTDNLVHIAHNVTIGEHSVIVGQVGIAGSTTIGRYAIFAGQAGIAGHLTIGDQVTVGPQCGVHKSVDSKQVVSGTTLAMPHRTWLRLQKVLPDLPDLYKRFKLMEERLSQLETKNMQ
jgi:UDP-3-O-[3-hydroxymyristoyl] glucosamine N-acyltransferase